MELKKIPGPILSLFLMQKGANICPFLRDPVTFGL